MCNQEIPEEVIKQANKECICCYECNDTPCEGALSYNNMCDRAGCSCEPEDEDECGDGDGSYDDTM